MQAQDKGDFTLGKNKKLKSPKQIEQLFAAGKRAQKGAVIAVYLPTADTSTKVAVSVPKRNFKRAVDRNRIKRLLKEAYRLNQDILHSQRIHLMLIFRGKQAPNFNYVQKCVRSTLSQIDEHLASLK